VLRGGRGTRKGFNIPTIAAVRLGERGEDRGLRKEKGKGAGVWPRRREEGLSAIHGRTEKTDLKVMGENFRLQIRGKKKGGGGPKRETPVEMLFV